MNVIKRDGRVVLFNEDKIVDAIKQAMSRIEHTNDELPERIAKEIKNLNKEEYTVEEIQDMVEKKLMASSYKDVAKEYILYRNKRNSVRTYNSNFMKDITKKLKATDVQNQNANVDEKSFGGRIGEASDVLMKQYALDYCVSDMAKNNHLNNEIYIHDLSHYAIGDHNCLSIPFDDLLKNGFNTRQTDVRPARSVNTAFQLLAVIFQLQSLQQFGGVSATHIDWTMVPYVKLSFIKHYLLAYIKQTEDFLSLDLLSLTNDELEDWIDNHKTEYFKKMNLTEEEICISNKENLNSFLYNSALMDTIRETYQAVEGMYHNLNTLQSRSGNQLPFTSINYGTCTSPEGRMVTKALLEVLQKGIGKLHRTSIFPCGIFQKMKGINQKKGDPNYDLYRLALKTTALRLYPNYANCDWSGNKGYDINDPRTYFSTMGK